MGAGADGTFFVPGGNFKVHHLAVFRHAHDLGLDPDLHAYGSGGIVADVQVGAHAALIVVQEILEGGLGSVFHHGGHERRAEYRQQAGADLGGGQVFGDCLFQLTLGSNQNHREFLLFSIRNSVPDLMLFGKSKPGTIRRRALRHQIPNSVQSSLYKANVSAGRFSYRVQRSSTSAGAAMISKVSWSRGSP